MDVIKVNKNVVGEVIEIIKYFKNEIDRLRKNYLEKMTPIMNGIDNNLKVEALELYGFIKKINNELGIKEGTFIDPNLTDRLLLSLNEIYQKIDQYDNLIINY